MRVAALLSASSAMGTCSATSTWARACLVGGVLVVCAPFPGRVLSALLSPLNAYAQVGRQSLQRSKDSLVGVKLPVRLLKCPCIAQPMHAIAIACVWQQAICITAQAWRETCGKKWPAQAAHKHCLATCI